MFVWPNHAIYINQNKNIIENLDSQRRIEEYGCLDVEIVRILEILNLRSALIRAYDRELDQQRRRFRAGCE
jgi:hypothetical protein